MRSRTHDDQLARSESAAIHAAAEAKFGRDTDEWHAECQILRLKEIADHGLESCYSGYDDINFQGDFGSGWYSYGELDALRQIRMVLTDPRLPDIAETIRICDEFDMIGELAATYLEFKNLS